MKDIEQPLTFSGGVNTLDHPLALRDDQTTRCANAFPNRDGILEKRPGVAPIREFSRDSGSDLLMKRFLFLHIPLPELGFDYATFYIYDGNNQQRLYLADNGSDVIIATGYEVSPPCWVDYNSSCYAIAAFPTLTEGFYKTTLINNVQTWYPATFNHNVGATVPDVQSQKIPVLPRFACVYKNRVRFFNFGANMGHWMVSGDAYRTGHTDNTNNPISTVVGTDVLSYNGRHVEFAGIVGETIIGGGEVMLSAVSAPIEAALLLLTEKSALICTGDMTQTSDADSTDPLKLVGDFTANKVNYEVGCCSPHTFIKTPYGYIWSSGTDVWAFRDNAPVKIGTLISNDLSAYPEDGRKFWTAAYCENKYILQCVSAKGSDDRYHQKAQWWLDLTKGLPQSYQDARWFGPMEILRDGTDETTPTHISGIVADRDGKRVVGTALTGSFVSDATIHETYLVDYTSPNQIDDVLFPTYRGGLEWTALTDYTIGDVIRPSFNGNNGRLFQCDIAGQSGATEPVWPDGAGAFVVDGTANWCEVLASPAGTAYIRLLNINSATELYSVGVDIISKEFTLQYAELDKILKRIEMYVYASQLTLLWLNILVNQGATAANAVFALFGQGEKQLRGGDANLDNTPITLGQLEGKSLRPLVNTIIRGKSMQIRLRDGVDNLLHPLRGQFEPGLYYIDDTCNKIIFGAFTSDFANAVLYQGTIELNAYGFQSYTLTGLMNAVVDAMNEALTGQLTLGSGFGIGSNPWSTVSTVNAGFPYFNNLALTFDNRNSTWYTGLFHGTTNSYDLSALSVLAGFELSPIAGTLFDFAKSRRLLSILGFDTASYNVAKLNTILGVGSDPIFFTPECINNVSASPTSIYAKEVVAYAKTAKVGIAEGKLFARGTRAKPLGFKNR